MKRTPTPLALATLLALAAPAFAHAGWYGGLSVGQSRTSDDLASSRKATINGLVTSNAFDAKDTGYRAFAGYRFLPWLAVEGDWSDLGRSRLRTGVSSSQQIEDGSVTMERKVSGFGIDAVFSAPLMGDRASIFGKVGAVAVRTEAEVTLQGLVVFPGGSTDRRRTTSNDETVGRFGLGAEFMATPNAGVRLEWQRWLEAGRKFESGAQGATGEADTDFYTLSVVYRF